MALARGSLRKMWFASFSRMEDSHWLICHLLCLGNQSLKSLLNIIPEGHFSSQPQLLFLFILVLFSWLLLLWFVIISNPLGWITRPRKGCRHPQRDRSRSLPGQCPRCKVADSRLSFSSPTNPARSAARWPDLEGDEGERAEPSLRLSIAHGLVSLLGSQGRWLSACSGPGGAGTAPPGHRRIVLLRRLVYQRGAPLPNSFKAVALQRKSAAACEKPRPVHVQKETQKSAFDIPTPRRI